jgi:hypothetical protein
MDGLAAQLGGSSSKNAEAASKAAQAVMHQLELLKNHIAAESDDDERDELEVQRKQLKGKLKTLMAAQLLSN